MMPLTELAQGPIPILDSDQVEHLFGPITQVLCHHELFYMALTTKTMAWTATVKIRSKGSPSTFSSCRTYSHPDKIHLQMVLTKFEGIVNYLNEGKQQVELHSQTLQQQSHWAPI